MAAGVIAGCALAGDMPRTRETLDALPTLGLQPNASCMNGLISGLLTSDDRSTIPKVCNPHLSSPSLLAQFAQAVTVTVEQQVLIW